MLREIVRNPGLALNPVGFVDDDARMRGQRVDGVRVLGAHERAARGSSTRPSPTR